MDLVAGIAQMNQRSAGPGLGIMPIIALLAFGLPLLWYYGPQVARPQIDVRPGQETEWYVAHSTEGPFATDPSSKDCVPTTLISVARPGERIAWISDFDLDPHAADDAEYHMERQTDGARLHSTTTHTPVGGDRRGKKAVCYQVPADAANGLYEIRRSLMIYPPNGAAFRRENSSIPLEVRAAP